MASTMYEQLCSASNEKDKSEADISIERITPPFHQSAHTFLCFDWPINGGDQTS